jgi:tartrate-resistant acid phosphatase type 5
MYVGFLRVPPVLALTAAVFAAVSCSPGELPDVPGSGGGGAGGGSGGGAGGGVGTPPGVVRFVVLGDGGTGKDEQFQVGQAVADVCDDVGCDFALYLGDNIYETGVTDVDDEQFEEKFELPYAALDFPFYVVLGNHDYGNLGLGLSPWKTDHQVAYTDHSDKWTMPDKYYSFVRENVTFFGIDTNAILQGFDADVQEAWLEDELADASTPWRIAFGHHPYISNGHHGNAGHFDGNDPDLVPIMSGLHFQQLFEEQLCGQIDVYFAGHDHNRQWLPEACGVQHFVSGSAAKLSDLEGRDGNVAEYEDDSEQGFMWVQIEGDELLGRFYDLNGELDYEQTMTRPSATP